MNSEMRNDKLEQIARKLAKGVSSEKELSTAFSQVDEKDFGESSSSRDGCTSWI
jgi:hypothetical protein